MKGPKIESWIKAGYKLLGQEGLAEIKVEKLAHSLDLNKSGFYHYFGSMEFYMKSMIEYHINLAKQIAIEISDCKTIDPDLLVLIVKHKAFFQVESQLLTKSKSTRTFKNFDEASKILNAEILLLWGKTIEVTQESSISQAFANILHHFFYARINSEIISYNFLHDLTEETKDVLSKVVEGQRSSHVN